MWYRMELMKSRGAGSFDLSSFLRSNSSVCHKLAYVERGIWLVITTYVKSQFKQFRDSYKSDVFTLGMFPSSTTTLDTAELDNGDRDG